MKKIFSQSALSLLELVVAIVLVSLILLGVFSIGNVLNNSNLDYGQRYLVRSETQMTLNHILNNASLAVGSMSNDSYGNVLKGILIGTAGLGNGDATNNPNSFCIHQAGGNNLTGNNNDIWLCYTWYASSDSTYPNQIVYCSFLYTAASGSGSYRGATNCSTSTGRLTGPTFLGTAYSITNAGTSGFPSSPYFVADGTQMLFSINIQNCLTNSAASCNSTGTSTDPVNNPEVQLFGSVIPIQHSM